MFALVPPKKYSRARVAEPNPGSLLTECSKRHLLFNYSQHCPNTRLDKTAAQELAKNDRSSPDRSSPTAWFRSRSMPKVSTSNTLHAFAGEGEGDSYHKLARPDVHLAPHLDHPCRRSRPRASAHASRFLRPGRHPLPILPSLRTSQGPVRDGPSHRIRLQGKTPPHR